MRAAKALKPIITNKIILDNPLEIARIVIDKKIEDKTIKPYYSKPKFQLYQANCLELLKQIPENSIDMIFADPPYFLSSGSFTCQNGG